MLRILIKLILMIWTFPNTMIGLTVGLVGLLTGGRAQIREGCIEFYGGLVEKGLQKLRVSGMTLGLSLIHI